MTHSDYQAEKKEGSILICDIRNFTTLFEAEDPMAAIKFANTVLTTLGREVEGCGGTVDRFTGDGFLAHFGITDDSKKHALNACKAALGMRCALRKINQKRYSAVQHVVAAGTGIHTGTVAFGEIKTRQLNQKTVLGDVVNTTARIEELTKYFSVDVLISQHCYAQVRDDFKFKKMPLKNLRGKKNQVHTHWLLPLNG